MKYEAAKIHHMSQNNSIHLCMIFKEIIVCVDLNSKINVIY